MLQRLGLKLKITLLFVAVFSLSCAGISYYLYQTLSTTYQEEYDTFIMYFVDKTAEAIGFGMLGDVQVDQAQLREHQKLFPFQLDEILFQLRAIDGRFIAKSNNLSRVQIPLEKDELKTVRRMGWQVRNWSVIKPIAGHRQFRVVNRLTDKGAGRRFVLQIAVPNRVVHIKIKSLRSLLLLFLPILLFMATIIGYWFSIYALKPLRSTISTAKRLSAQKLGTRIPVPSGQDEIRDLVVTLNDLFTRLEDSFSSMERFISDASHQLKTPMAILQMEVDSLKRDLNDPEAAGKNIESIQDELQRLVRLVSNMLIMARVDRSDYIATFSEARIDEIVLTEVENIAPLAREKEQQIKVEYDDIESDHHEDYSTRCDPGLLGSMFQSLLENSVKYSPAGSLIKVNFHKTQKKTIVAITDQGPGIDPDEKDKVFDRFFRGRGSSVNQRGSGLGLSIANRIADIHEAKLELNSAIGGGTVARVVF
jgi:two-component system OmpR family sensor kinase